MNKFPDITTAFYRHRQEFLKYMELKKYDRCYELIDKMNSLLGKYEVKFNE